MLSHLFQADLSGIKWQKFSAETAGLSDDPVLTAFTKCLSLDILAVWRRSPKKSSKNSRPSQVQPFSKLLLFFYNLLTWKSCASTITDWYNNLAQGSTTPGTCAKCDTRADFLWHTK